ncbi:MAG: translation initiation factor eIF 4e-like domain-containing protein [Piptocephalis tieghemiana]|nr:MAG: translation initiation factor eIF 4e-like domain-containing protein [Piptocephalis tieghemiana]
MSSLSTSSPLSPTASASASRLLAARDLPLQHEWTFWHDRNDTTAADYESNLSPLHTVHTVQDFWRVFNNIPGPDRLTGRSSLHFMRQGVKPLWEDPWNQEGGCWSFRVRKEDTPKVWIELLMLLVGEQLDCALESGDELGGVTVSCRWNSDIVQVWTKRATKSGGSHIMEEIQKVLPSTELQSPYYKAHAAHEAYQK